MVWEICNEEFSDEMLAECILGGKPWPHYEGGKPKPKACIMGLTELLILAGALPVYLLVTRS